MAASANTIAVVTGCVTDFAAPNVDASTSSAITLQDLQKYAKQLPNMRLTFDHEHPVHKGAGAPHITVGTIKSAWIHDTEQSLYVDTEIDRSQQGQRIVREIREGFLKGFSLGLDNRMQLNSDGTSTHEKELIELSITPKPEFANAQIVSMRQVMAFS